MSYKWESRCVALFNKIAVLLSEGFHMFIYIFLNTQKLKNSISYYEIMNIFFWPTHMFELSKEIMPHYNEEIFHGEEIFICYIPNTLH